MVGEDPEVKFADVMAGFIGKPFRPGGTGPDGYDCIGLCWAVLRALGRDVPAEYAGWSVERGDYAEWAAADRAAADALVRENDGKRGAIPSRPCSSCRGICCWSILRGWARRWPSTAETASP